MASANEHFTHHLKVSALDPSKITISTEFEFFGGNYSYQDSSLSSWSLEASVRRRL